MNVSVDEADRQMILLALAHLVVERPGWEYTTREISKQFHGEPMYDDFLRMRREEVADVR